MNKQKQLVIITGMSGAGKSLATATFEDLNFFCIDNLPPNLLPGAVDSWLTPREPGDVAIVVDARAGQFFPEVLPMCHELHTRKMDHFMRPVLLFLDASDAELRTIAGQLWGDLDGTEHTERTVGKGRVFRGLPLTNCRRHLFRASS